MLTLVILLSVLLVVAIGVAGALEARGNHWQREADIAREQRDQAEIRYERLLDTAAADRLHLLQAHRALRRCGYDGALPVLEEVSPAAEGRETPAPTDVVPLDRT